MSLLVILAEFALPTAVGLFAVGLLLVAPHRHAKALAENKANIGRLEAELGIGREPINLSREIAAAVAAQPVVDRLFTYAPSNQGWAAWVKDGERTFSAWGINQADASRRLRDLLGRQ